MQQVLETERLIVRRFNEQDAPFILELLNTPGWLKFIGDRNIRTLEDARVYILNAPLFSYHKFGFGPYLVQLKATAEPIGMCSLIKRDTLEEVDLGFALLPNYLGKAYAYEMSRAVMHYAKHTLGIKKLAGITNQDNRASIQLLKKLGFTPQGTVKMPGEEEELFYFTY